MPRILIVDDYMENRYLLETILQSRGHATVSAGDGAEALRLAGAQDFDLVLSDILMPVMDGFALCRAWKQDSRLARIPFVFYTATYTEPKDEQFALSLGADRFLVKPLPPEAILQAVQELVGREAKPLPALPTPESSFFHQHNLALIRKLEKKLADNERLEASNARFGQILAASSNEIFIFDGDTLRFTLVSQGALEHLGYLESELQAGTPLELCPEIGAEAFSALLQPLRDGTRDKVTIETSLRARDGSAYPVEVRLEPILDGQQLSFLAVVRDLTERRRMEAEIQHAQKLESLGRMASGVAHDLNNLLAPILGLAGLLQERYGDDPKLNRTLGTILKAAEQGRDLVRGLTDFARKGMQVTEPVDLNALVLQAVELLKEGGGPSVRWELDLAEDLPRILGDPSDLSRVLLNLIRNALDAMARQGTVRLRTRRPTAQWVQLEVQDTGPGIPPELLGQVMEPFFTTKARGKGTGLGLAIVNSIIRAHAGTVSIQSQAGQGTTVLVQLPAARA